MIRKQLLALGLFFGGILLWGQSPDSLKTYTLPTVRVIVTKPSEAIGALHLIDAADKQSSLTLQDALSQNLGISSSTGSKDESNIRLRGFRKNEVRIMVDGRPLNSGYFGNVDLSKLSLLNIKEIQVIKGPTSPLYGTNNLGGVVNLITREAPNDRWLSLKATIKRNNTQELSISSAHSFDAWNYLIGVGREHTDGFVLSEDFTSTFAENGQVRNNAARTVYNLMGNISTEIWDFHRVGVDFAYTTMARREIPSSIYEGRIRLYDDWERYHATLSAQSHLSDKLQATLLNAFDGGGDRYLEYNDATMQQLQTDSRMDNLSWHFAPRLRWFMASGSILDFGMKSELQFNHRKDNGVYQERTNNHVLVENVFAQMERDLGQSLRFTMGMGLTASNNKLRKELYYIAEPALGMEQEYASGAKTTLGLGQNSAQPTLRQLYSSSKGNPYLKPQSAVKLELGHHQPFWGNRLAVDGSVYWNSTHNLIDLVADRYENIYRIKTYGAELQILTAITSFWSSELSYARLEEYDGGAYRLTETPKHSFSMVQRLSCPMGSSLSISSNYRSSRVSQDDGGTYHNLQSYWLHDLALDIPWRNYKLYLGLENILDENYEGEYGFPEAGRNFSIGINADF